MTPSEGAGTSGDPTSDTVEDNEFDEWSRTLDELEARADTADAGGDPREIGPAYLALAEHFAGVADLDLMIDLLLTAREAFEEFDAGRATETMQAVGLVAQRSGDHAKAHMAFGIACDELADRDDPILFAGALNDFGAMCTQVGEFDDADEVLNLAIEIHRECGSEEAAVETRMNLANNLRLAGRRDEAERELHDLIGFFGAESLRGAMCRESLAGLHFESGRPDLSRTEFESAIRVYDRLHDDERATEARLGLALVLTGTGEVARGEKMLAEATAAFTVAGRPDRVAICEYNRANVAVARGDFTAADTAFDAAARGLAEAGMHHQVANLQWNRVKRLTLEASTNPLSRDTLAAEAVDTAVSALIAADYERFQFADADHRAQWRATLDHRVTMTFSLAHAFGSTTLIADLIESTLNAGVHGLRGGDESDEPASLDLSPRQRKAMTDLPDDPSSPAWTHGVAATLLDSAELPMTPPPALVDGDGRVLLARQRAMAAAFDPDLAEILEAAPRVPIW
ncbi:tetratricopeptide repeat protein [Gordonia sp. NPDC003376]